jgi:isoquinoline 1-oxidoreductase beta subunit
MIALTVNGTRHEVDVPADMPLLWVIRETLGLTGTKFGCGIAQCGACTVHLDGRPIDPAPRRYRPAGRSVTTIEGLSPDAGTPCSRPGLPSGVPQCGHASRAADVGGGALTEHPAPTTADRHGDVRQHLSLRHLSADPPRHPPRGADPSSGFHLAHTTPSRRTFLKTSALDGGGLVVGAYLPGLTGHAAAAGVFEPNIWVRIGSDDTVRIMLTQLEMGQGVMTSMPMLVAEELDVDWANIRTEWVGANAAYANPGLGQQLTAGSNSVRSYWRPLREAGAAARVMLIAAAAQTWGVPAASCTTAKGEVIHGATGRRARYGALVDKAAALPVPQQVRLKDPGEFQLLGRSLARLDVPEKVNGAAVYGIDISRPDMLIARVVRCPVFGGTVARFNADKAKAVPGVRHVVQISTGLAVVADTYFAASRGAQVLDVTWNDGPWRG